MKSKLIRILSAVLVVAILGLIVYIIVAKFFLNEPEPIQFTQTTTITPTYKNFPNTPFDELKSYLPILGENGIDILIDSETLVHIKREGWNAYYPASFGTLIRHGDLLKVNDGESAIMLCGGTTVIEFDHTSGNPCPPPLPIIEIDGEPVISPEVKYYPSGSIVVKISKFNIEGDTPPYKLNIIVFGQSDSPKDQKISFGTSNLIYPWIWETNSRYLYYTNQPTNNPTSDSWSISYGLDPFVASDLLTDKNKYINIKFESDAYKQFNANRWISVKTDDDLKITKLIYYISQNQLDDALNTIEELIEEMGTPPMYRWYGDILFSQNLTEDSKAAYLQSIDLAQVTGDLETEAVANIMLWHVTTYDKYLIRAAEIYSSIGETKLAMLIEKMIKSP